MPYWARALSTFCTATRRSRFSCSARATVWRTRILQPLQGRGIGILHPGNGRGCLGGYRSDGRRHRTLRRLVRRGEVATGQNGQGNGGNAGLQSIGKHSFPR